MGGATKAWILVLALVFLMNVFVLVYFIFHRGLVTDFTEPPNLFALAVNSPPSHVLAGSCGGGPEGKQYMVNWFVNHEGNHLYMEPGEKSHLLGGHGNPHTHTHPHDPSLETPPQGSKNGSSFFASIMETIRRGLGMKERHGPTRFRSTSAVENFRPSATSRTDSIASDYEMQNTHTRLQRNFRTLAKRRSVL